MRKKVGKGGEKWGQSGENKTAVWTCYHEFQRFFRILNIFPPTGFKKCRRLKISWFEKCNLLTEN